MIAAMTCPQLGSVLNASRHHRYFHAQRHADLCSLHAVLNASRHHRYFHRRRICVEYRIGHQCSTPRGITGTFTGGQRSIIRRGFCAQRLAASQVLSPAPSARDAASSCGAQRLAASQVLSRSTLRHRRDWIRGAQRLAASQVLSPSRRGSRSQYRAVLNASRHHRYFHNRNQRRDLSPASRAQRLAASQVLSRRWGWAL